MYSVDVSPGSLGLSTAAFIFIMAGFWFLKSKIDTQRKDFDDFKREQESKCLQHKQDAQKSFDKLESRISEGFKTVFDRIESLTQILIESIQRGKE